MDICITPLTTQGTSQRRGGKNVRKWEGVWKIECWHGMAWHGYCTLELPGAMCLPPHDLHMYHRGERSFLGFTSPWWFICTWWLAGVGVFFSGTATKKTPTFLQITLMRLSEKSGRKIGGLAGKREGVGRRRMGTREDNGSMWSKHIVCMCENTIMKPVFIYTW